MLAARPSTYSPTVSCLQLIFAPDRSRSHSCYTSPCLQVKSRMRNREQYQDFLKCLNMFTEDIITKHELQSLVSDALNRHPDLQVGACSCVCCSHFATVCCWTHLNMQPDLEVRASSCSSPSSNVNSKAQMHARARFPWPVPFDLFSQLQVPFPTQLVQLGTPSTRVASSAAKASV